jgi:Fe2+ transport system protein FeoA
MRLRLMDMGMLPGAEVKVRGFAPLGDPMDIIVRGYHLALRKKEASSVSVELLSD